ncbi:hypothetical protein H6G20_05025 [Desertifilum sp. FACHB-1129]|uniref:Uncharacterized protein n=1 Tax=Desertifilum tharense IPPAS B-1220 TaxID=1781255 RepID=A0A1E5QN22_9CYAN|nr:MULTISPECIES: hypothetical protein [Desertifilum]MDA0208847.1 hypothetical protein [Cyanobacteria bacterium FC1]MBD2311048.1 hypothetical protein [Desertifilum sp. FACHB-1129]MBD2321453.1 hypothetical protein [Desertifilum sp. FACHB-866]MBD2331240.1 hypothetical protein [Desertifilum sp. FACHB-868]OEJ75987.1 hypothetical protein BH720_06835 [Desertifilum tharense IPPAS B-1220]
MAESHSHADDKLSRSLSEEKSSLSYQGVYTCPVCRHGQISALPLMDAFACNFCRHIFTADLDKQRVQVVDGSQPLSWRWTGKTWKATHRREDLDLTWEIWLVGIALVFLPPTLIGLAYHTFPPMPNSYCTTLSPWDLLQSGGICSAYWFPVVWTVLTFFSHLSFVSWLVLEHFQFPLYVALKVRWQQLLRQRA